MKHCRKCDTTKPLPEFGNRARSVDGKQAWCKGCMYVATQAWRTKNRARANEIAGRSRDRLYAANPEMRRKHALRSKVGRYGLTDVQFLAMLADQDDRCAVCRRLPAEGRSLVVDHDHSCCPGIKKSCGRCVRGLLCNNCNAAIGFMDDDPARLMAAKDYLHRTIHTLKGD